MHYFQEILDFEKIGRHIAGEMCFTMHDAWGSASKDFNYKSPALFIEHLCRCRKVGANFLLNIGPDQNGKIIKIEEDENILKSYYLKYNLLYRNVKKVTHQNRIFFLRNLNP